MRLKSYDVILNNHGRTDLRKFNILYFPFDKSCRALHILVLGLGSSGPMTSGHGQMGPRGITTTGCRDNRILLGSGIVGTSGVGMIRTTISRDGQTRAALSHYHTFVK